MKTKKINGEKLIYKFNPCKSNLSLKEFEKLYKFGIAFTKTPSGTWFPLKHLSFDDYYRIISTAHNNAYKDENKKNKT